MNIYTEVKGHEKILVEIVLHILKLTCNDLSIVTLLGNRGGGGRGEGRGGGGRGDGGEEVEEGRGGDGRGEGRRWKRGREEVEEGTG